MPYKSAAQRGYFHANRARLEAQGVNVAEWDHASKGMKLPFHAKTGGKIQAALRAARKYADGGAAGSDYDMDAAVAAGIKPDARWHWPDTYKRPNHMTFSDGSIYSTPQAPGGHWQNVQGDEWNFAPSDTNLQQHSVQELQDYFQKYEPKSNLILSQPMADGGEVDEWENVPRTPEGTPKITVTKPPTPGELVSKYARQAADWFSQPSQIKPDMPPPQDLQQGPSQTIGSAVRGAGTGMVQDFKELANPFEKNEEGKYVADQPLPDDAYKGKVPATQKDLISQGAPVGASVISNLAGAPGKGMLWGMGKSIAAGAMGATAKTGIKSAARTGFLDTAHFKPIGLSKGTMPGGFKVDPATGTEWYVKRAPSLEQARNEKLTAELYKLFGVDVADVQLTTVGGKPGIASRKIEGTQLGQANIPYNQISGLHENYPVHALLANHDAVGTGPENPLGNIIIDKEGKAHVIDTGGGLTYKGTGSKKAAFTPEVNELDTMRDPNYSQLSAHVFGDVDHQSALVGAQRIANVSGEDIAKLVEQYGPSSKMEKLNLLSTLLKRKHNIEQEFGVTPRNSTNYAEPPKPIKSTDYDLTPPARDPYEQIPFTEEDYNNFGKEIPPPLPDDVSESTHKWGKPARDIYELPFSKKLDPNDVGYLVSGIKDKDFAAVIAKQLSGGSAWDTAHSLWQIAGSVNPQTAEALFRALPPKIQVDVGHRIAALKDALDYSPWNSIAKGSGKDGKYPSEYDFYTTQTTAFKPPASVLKDKKFIDELDKYSAKIEGKEPEIPAPAQAPEPKTSGYEPIPNGYASSWLNAPKEVKKLLEHFKESDGGYDVKSIGQEIAAIGEKTPAYADNILYGLPSDLQDRVYPEFKKAKVAIEEAGSAKERELAESGKFSFLEGRNAANEKKNSPIGIAFASQYLEPIKDFKNWTPTGGFTPPAFKGILQKKLAKGTNFNTNFEIYKGGHFDNPHPEDPNYPEQIFDPSNKNTEPGWFGAKEKWSSGNYGKVGGSYIMRTDKAFTIDYQDYTGKHMWSPTSVHNAIRAAQKQGADLLIVKNMKDPTSGFHDQYIILNTAILRGPNAKFNPALLHKSYPLAGVAGGGLFTYGAVSEGKDKDKMNRGGIPALLHKTRKMARGGGTDLSGGYHPRHPAGMIKSSIPGRTDKIPLNVPSGSFIVPADIPSALGQGNTLAGEKILGTMFKSGPYSPGSTAQLSGKLPAGRRPPRAPSLPRIHPIHMGKFADGGEASHDPGVDIVAAGGEQIIYPDQVKEAGHGDIEAGHKVLHQFVVNVRKNYIKTLSNLKPPKKN